MIFFDKKNNCCKIAPSFPTRNGGINLCYRCLDPILSGIGYLYYLTFLIHFIIEKIIFRMHYPIPWFGIFIFNDIFPLQSKTRLFAIKPDIKFSKLAVNDYSDNFYIICNFRYAFIYFKEVGMIAILKCGHCQRKAIPITEEKRVHIIPFFQIINLFATTINWRVRTVNAEYAACFC